MKVIKDSCTQPERAMHTIIKILVGGLCCLTVGIINAQNTSASNLPAKTALIQLKISREGDGYKITVRDITVTNDQRKKPVRVHEQLYQNNDLVCFILDKSNAVIDSIIITEPLARRYEYPREDGTIGSKEVAVNEKDIIIRTRYNPGMEYLRILKVTGKTTRQNLATVKLPSPKMRK